MSNPARQLLKRARVTRKAPSLGTPHGLRRGAKVLNAAMKKKR